ncbi:MAG: DUF3458 domain-containing protein, partial [Gammaproteobacteria bacterium]|nr:DUF3458 domain-containing protein [Gammaproteobacteria bacterium]
LFALVAGDLGVIERPYETADGKDVRLRIFSEHKNIEQCHFALDCLEKAMRWDERRFGLNYDLSDFMVVAVDAFNFGAMENKGLNVFNSALLLADPETASDMDMQRVDAVVAHEYFHNWSGNRVTCRDWFQISLKEGLTVYREQEYMADHYDRATARVEDIKLLRQQQFPEDDGPMAHPVRPAEYSKIDNFYSATVYEKGAEVIRMMESLLGREAFDRGIALYFERHDGQAVTCDDFVQAMQDASNVNLDSFKRWYSQAGRPRVTLDFSYDAQAKQLHIDYQQRIDNQPYPDPLTLPCKVALLDAAGTEIKQNEKDAMLVMDQFEGRLTLSEVPSEPTVLPFVALSAPVSVHQSQSNSALALALRAAPDGYSRYEAAQQLIQRAYWQDDQDAQSHYLETISSLLDQPLSPRLLAMLLAFPSFDEVKSGHAQIDVDQFCDFKRQILNAIGEQNSAGLMAMFESLHQRTRNSGYEAASERMLLTQLMRLMPKEHAYASALKLYDTANNLSERTASLQWLCANGDDDDINRRLDDAYQRWSHHSVALDHWFRAQVSGDGEYNRNRFTALLSHPDYTHKIPNRVRSLMAAFMVGSVTSMLRSTDLHARLFSETLKVDGINPMMGARLGGLLNRWKDYSGRIGDSLHSELEALSKEDISDTLREIVEKSLV